LFALYKNEKRVSLRFGSFDGAESATGSIIQALSMLYLPWILSGLSSETLSIVAEVSSSLEEGALCNDRISQISIGTYLLSLCKASW